MKRLFIAPILVLAFLGPIADAQTNAPGEGSLITPKANCALDLNRFGLSYRVGFNIKARFRNLGGFPAMSEAGPPTGGVDHFYDNGYNRVKAGGNPTVGGRSVTTYWGYSDSDQVVGNSIVMDSASARPEAGTRNATDDPQHGVELTYSRQLGRSEHLRWGVEGAFGLSDLTFQNGSSLSSPVTVVSDSYDLGGITPPPAPYDGVFDPTGPAYLLSDTPSRSVRTIPAGDPGAAQITGRRHLAIDLYGIRLGPYLRVPLYRRLSASLNGGLAIVAVNSNFRFSESVSIEGAGTVAHRGSGSDSDWLFGGYAGGSLSYALTRSLDVSAAAQYQNTGTYNHFAGGKKAEVDLGETIFLSLGLGYSF